MKFMALILLSVLSACGGKNSSRDFGRMTEAQLIAEKGSPQSEEKIPVSDSKVLGFEENEKYQIQEGYVTHGFRDPKGDEKLVIYWKHKFKGHEVKDRKITASKSHLPDEHELKCEALGVTIVYSEGSAFVSRIIEHEKK